MTAIMPASVSKLSAMPSAADEIRSSVASMSLVSRTTMSPVFRCS
jgi:hypothetical protein